jgi:diguanylate cyclase (GGDEF)-like protein/PAS domain S-box-containing protein
VIEREYDIRNFIMTIANLPENETERIRALKSYDILDSPPEPAFDKLVELAAHICRTPIAVISLVDENRQWFKAVTGLDACETSRDVAFCAHSILSDEIMVVPDATMDIRFFDNPLVTGAPGIRFYAGVPLVTPDQYPLGTLCVIDYVPRILIESELKALKIIAEQAIAQLELRLSLKKNKQFANDLRHTKQLLALDHERLESKKRYKQMFDDAASIAFLLDPSNGCIVDANKAASIFWGYSRDELRGMPISNINTSTQEENIASIVQLLYNRTHHLEWIQKLKNGEIRHVEVYGGPLVIRDGTLLYSVLHDISNRKQVEANLIEKELQYRTLADSGQALIWTSGTDGLCDYFNKVWLNFTGRSIEQELGNGWTEGVHPDDYQQCIEIYVSAFDRREKFGMDYRLRHHSGDYHWIRDEGCPRYNSKGVFIGYIGYSLDITDRKKWECQSAQLSFALNHIKESVFLMGDDAKFIYVNDEACSALGYSKEEFLGGMGVPDISMGWTKERFTQYWQKLKSIGSDSIESNHRRKDGSVFPVEIFANYFEYDGRAYNMSMVRNISRRKKDEENLRITASVFENSQEAIMISDADNSILDINPAFTIITGYSREEVVGKNPKVMNSGRQDKAFYEAMWQSLNQDKRWRGEIWNRRKSGEIYAELLAISAICDINGKVKHYVAVFSDINNIKQHEAELSRVAHYDSLTNVPNRVLLADRLGQAIARSLRSDKLLSVCYLDLDGFKQVNDQYGHAAGDQLLVEVSKRLQDSLRVGDTIARLGGDEFVLLFNDLANQQECLIILERILDLVAKPIIVSGYEVAVSASIGVTFLTDENEDGDSLLRYADQAMYIAKQKGKGRYHVHQS